MRNATSPLLNVEINNAFVVTVLVVAVLVVADALVNLSWLHGAWERGRLMRSLRRQVRGLPETSRLN